MKKFKINGTLKEGISLQHAIKHLTVKVGCSYSEDIELDNIELTIDENLTGALYDIDTYSVSEI